MQTAPNYINQGTFTGFRACKSPVFYKTKIMRYDKEYRNKVTNQKSAICFSKILAGSGDEKSFLEI